MRINHSESIWHHSWIREKCLLQRLRIDFTTRSALSNATSAKQLSNTNSTKLDKFGNVRKLRTSRLLVHIQWAERILFKTNVCSHQPYHSINMVYKNKTIFRVPRRRSYENVTIFVSEYEKSLESTFKRFCVEILNCWKSMAVSLLLVRTNWLCWIFWV